jgi:hypothetical protein
MDARRGSVTDFEKLLNDVIEGRNSLAPLRSWLEVELNQPDCDPEILYTALEQAQKTGLAQPVAMALRKQIDAKYNVDSGVAEGTEQAQTITSVTVTTTETQPETAAHTRDTAPTHEHTQTDTDRTLTSPLSSQPSEADPFSDENMPAAGSHEERTVMMTTTGDSGSDRTITGISAGSVERPDEYDPFSPDATASASPSEPTSTSWGGGSEKNESPIVNKIGPGAVLKERFELVNVLGGTGSFEG